MAPSRSKAAVGTLDYHQQSFACVVSNMLLLSVEFLQDIVMSDAHTSAFSLALRRNDRSETYILRYTASRVTKAKTVLRERHIDDPCYSDAYAVVVVACETRSVVHKSCLLHFCNASSGCWRSTAEVSMSRVRLLTILHISNQPRSIQAARLFAIDRGVDECPVLHVELGSVGSR